VITPERELFDSLNDIINNNQVDIFSFNVFIDRYKKEINNLMVNKLKDEKIKYLESGHHDIIKGLNVAISIIANKE
jgi:hypothetical protein